MTRRTLIVGLLRDPLDIRELQQRVIDFEKWQDVFVKKLFGCDPAELVSLDSCKVYRQEIDRAAFAKAREAAKKLFQLKEPASTAQLKARMHKDEFNGVLDPTKRD